jgi:hypothetical protein
LLDPEQKSWLDTTHERLAEPVVLPYALGLPEGSYTLNGQPFQVAPGVPTTVTLQTLDQDTRHLELAVGLGVLGLLSDSTSHLFPSPQLDLTLVLPAGPMDVALHSQVGVQSRETPDGQLAVSSVGGMQLAGLIPIGSGPTTLRLGPSLGALALAGLRKPPDDIEFADVARQVGGELGLAVDPPGSAVGASARADLHHTSGRGWTTLGIRVVAQVSWTL